MKEQAETLENYKPEFEDIANSLESSDDDVRAAVSGVVSGEMRFWPEKITALIGGKHPSRDSFLKGVSYVIGGYLHLAREGASLMFKEKRLEAEKKTCALLAPVAQELVALRKSDNELRGKEILKLRAECVEEIQKVKEKFSSLIKGVEDRDKSNAMMGIIKTEDKIKRAYDGACRTIHEEECKLLSKIDEIASSREEWNSSDRKSRRLNRSNGFSKKNDDA